MSQTTFSLDGSPFIELNKLLKICSLVQSGGEAKMLIREGLVQVNGQNEDRVRCKLKPGDTVVIEDMLIEILE